MIPPEVLESIQKIANLPKLKSPSVIHDPDVSLNDVRKVVEATFYYCAEVLRREK